MLRPRFDLGRETRGPAVVAVSDGAVVDLDAHAENATVAQVRVAGVSLLLAAVLVTACLHLDEREAFVTEGNEICRELMRTLEGIGPPVRRDELRRLDEGELRARVARRSRASSRAGAEAIAKLRALEVPGDLAEERDAVFAAMARMRSTSLAFDAALRRRDGDQLATLLERFKADRRRVNARFREIGWTECVDEGTP